MKIKRPASLDEASFKYGVAIAAEIASEYDHLSTHPHLVSECILAKLNILPGKPRRNKTAKKLDQALTKIEIKVDRIHRRVVGEAKAAFSAERGR